MFTAQILSNVLISSYGWGNVKTKLFVFMGLSNIERGFGKMKEISSGSFTKLRRL